MISKNQKFIEPRIGESRETLADNTKIKTVLGWNPTRDIEQYIKENLK